MTAQNYIEPLLVTLIPLAVAVLFTYFTVRTIRRLLAARAPA